MNQFTVYMVTSVVLFTMGLWGVIALPHLLRKILAFNITGVGIFLFLVNLAGRGPGDALDNVPLAMVLTGIVVSVSATAFLLAIMRRIHAQTGATTLVPEGEDGDQ